MDWDLEGANNGSELKEDIFTRVVLVVQSPAGPVEWCYYMPTFCAKPIIIWDIGSKYGRTTPDFDRMFEFTCEDLFNFKALDKTIKEDVEVRANAATELKEECKNAW